MSENTEPFWYRLISEQVSDPDNLIENGLTIPYIIGAENLVYGSGSVDEQSIKLLLDEIINSSTEKFAVLQNCGDRLQQYVIGLRERKEEKKFSSVTSFQNDSGEKTLFITTNAADLGEKIEEICENLNNLYLPIMLESKFSCDRYTREWRAFNEEEEKIIKAI